MEGTMGCDIHLYKEKKENDIWVTADINWKVDHEYPDDVPDIPVEQNNINRNYDLFGLLADRVRTHFDYSFKVQGLPTDACLLVKNISERWGIDAHNHSYISLNELRRMAVDLLLMGNSSITKWQLRGISNILKLFPDDVDGDDYRVVFWFDN
jgi:hypothetical protein|tara:strand:+ start:137 stop:595 length:459 start_codon:yes stop_codon:yes gene_type:complete